MQRYGERNVPLSYHTTYTLPTSLSTPQFSLRGVVNTATLEEGFPALKNNKIVSHHTSRMK